MLSLMLLAATQGIWAGNAETASMTERTAYECPVDTARTRDIIDSFLLIDPRMEEVRIQTGTQGFTRRSQIEPLSDPEDTAVCRQLNNNHTDILAQTSYSADRDLEYFTHDVMYYKAGVFYFAVRRHADPPKPDDPELVVISHARSDIYIYDQGLNLIRRTTH